MPILFNLQEVLHIRYYNIHENEHKRYLNQTRSEAKSSGVVLPKVHGIDKGVDPNVQLEKQMTRPVVYQHNHMFPLSQESCITLSQD